MGLVIKDTLSEGRTPSIKAMADTMVESWKLATISMWADSLDKDEALRLIGDTFTWEQLWEAAVEVNQLCAARDMSVKIPRNRDQGDQKDRVGVLGNNLIGALLDLKNRTNKPVFVVSSANLFQVPGVIKDRVNAEPAVTARLDNIEKMIENLSKGFNEIKSNRNTHWPPLVQVNGVDTQSASREEGQGHEGSSIAQQLGVSRRPGAIAPRARSPSTKRTADQAQLESSQVVDQQGVEVPWSQVAGRQGRRPSMVQPRCLVLQVLGEKLLLMM